MKYFVYVLYSDLFKRTYTGQTNNLNSRLILHNKGRVKSTKSFCPWEVIYSEEFETRAQAMVKEKWFKNSTGKKKIAELLRKLNKV
ncbi:MAG: GIY-YIG nuclease family protein [Ignavibacteria bacterium]|nr:GIY-YIG nuclease family protein [Ignavibacteria bacterium]